MKTMKQVLSVATVLMAALATVGCGKNSDNGNNGVAVNYGAPGAYGSCAGCVGNTQPIAQATASDQLGEAIQLTFFGTSGATYGGSVGGQYTQVAAQGMMIIQGQSALQCGVPAGQYQVTTQGAPAVMNGLRIDNLNLIAVGPTQVRMMLNIYFIDATHMQVTVGSSGPSIMQGQSGYSQQPCQLAMY